MSDSNNNDEQPIVPQPKSITVENDGLSVRITRKWFSPSGFILLGFAIFWNGFIYNGFFDAPWEMALFMLPFIAVGACLAYGSLGILLNRTIIDVSVNELRIRHRPLPWLGNKRLDPVNIQQLYCKEHEKKSKSDSGKISYSYTYSVNVVTIDNKDIPLIKSLDEKSHAKYLEQCLEKELAIENRTVTGEI